MEQSRFDIQYAAMRAAIIEREFQHLNEKQREAVFHTEGPKPAFGRRYRKL